MPQMRSRREQVDAHRFITSRMNQALVLANPDSVERPLRRIGVSIFASVMIMVLILGGFLIAALLNKGNDDPMANHIIFEKGTNAIYVYTTMSGKEPTEDDPLKLWPVANYTSALLLLSSPYQDEPPTQSLKPESLSGYPRGFTIGIEGAPPSPPPPDSLLQNELWHVCSSPVRDGRNEHLVQVAVAKDSEPDMPAAEPLGEQWLYARTVEGDIYLLTSNRKYKIADDEYFNKVGHDEDDVATVKKEVIDTISPGPDLAITPRPEFGTPSDVTIDGIEANYGQPVQEGSSLYVLIEGADGATFAPISDVMRQLLEPEYGAGVTLEINSTHLTEHGAQGDYEEGSFPAAIPAEPVTVSGNRPAVCSTFDPTATGEAANMVIGTYETAPKLLTDHAESITMDDGTIIATGDPVAQTVLPSGHAALVSPQQQPGTTVKSVTYLIDSLGYKFGIQDSGTQHGSTKALLGYSSVEPVGVPESVLSLVQAGAVLDPEEARSELDPSGESQVPFDSGESEEAAAEEGGE
ncbi:type VII secretion protein EccB [Glycomyces tarimensis]